MNFPLSFLDISLWLAATTVILFITSELIAPYHEKRLIPINRKRLRNVALLTALFFFITVSVRVYETITQSAFF